MGGVCGPQDPSVPVCNGLASHVDEPGDLPRLERGQILLSLLFSSVSPWKINCPSDSSLFGASLRLVLLALVYPASAPAQAASTTAPHSTEVGMPILESHSYKEFSAVPQVWTILQDRRGVMYMGVSGGEMAEYDGVSWRKIDTAMDIVRSLAMDDRAGSGSAATAASAILRQIPRAP